MWLATGWMVRGSNPGGGEIFRTCPDRPWGPPGLLYNGTGSFLGGKERLRHDADPSSASSAVGHEGVALYPCSPCGPYGLYRASVPVQGWPLPFSWVNIFFYIVPCLFNDAVIETRFWSWWLKNLKECGRKCSWFSYGSILVAGNGESCITRSWMIRTLYPILCGW
jgi:hypothetical protein